jgi:hypothetical protein
MPSMNWCAAKIAGNVESGTLDLSFGIREIATLLAAKTPLAAKLASAEKHMILPSPANCASTVDPTPS